MFLLVDEVGGKQVYHERYEDEAMVRTQRPKTLNIQTVVSHFNLSHTFITHDHFSEISPYLL